MAAVGAATVEGSRQVAEACGADPQTVDLVGNVVNLALIVVPGTMAAHEAALMREAAFANRARKLGAGGRAPPVPEGATPGGSVQGEPPPHAYRGERPQGTGGATQRLSSKSETTVKAEVTGAAAESPTPANGAQKTGGTTPGLGKDARYPQEKCKIPGVPTRSATTKEPMEPNDVLEDMLEYLGWPYRAFGTDRFVSGDGLRQVRMKDGDILGLHGSHGPHVHFEDLRTKANFHRQIRSE